LILGACVEFRLPKLVGDPVGCRVRLPGADVGNIVVLTPAVTVLVLDCEALVGDGVGFLEGLILGACVEFPLPKLVGDVAGCRVWMPGAEVGDIVVLTPSVTVLVLECEALVGDGVGFFEGSILGACVEFSLPKLVGDPVGCRVRSPGAEAGDIVLLTPSVAVLVLECEALVGDIVGFLLGEIVKEEPTIGVGVVLLLGESVPDWPETTVGDDEGLLLGEEAPAEVGDGVGFWLGEVVVLEPETNVGDGVSFLEGDCVPGGLVGVNVGFLEGDCVAGALVGDSEGSLVGEPVA
jgi:hypothetical protein